MIKAHIRKAKKSDAASILFLIQELAIFEKEPRAVIVTQAQIEKTVLETVLYLNVCSRSDQSSSRYGTLLSSLFHLERAYFSFGRFDRYRAYEG